MTEKENEILALLHKLKLTECGLAVRELLLAEVFAVQVKKIERKESWISAAEQKITESRRPLPSTHTISPSKTAVVASACRAIDEVNSANEANACPLRETNRQRP